MADKVYKSSEADRERASRWYHEVGKHRPKQRDPVAQRRYSLKAKYGITPEDYDRLLTEQGGVCAICGAEGSGFPVDHDHSTGRVRGILCTACNLGLGKFGDSALRLESALRYLRRSE